MGFIFSMFAQARKSAQQRDTERLDGYATELHEKTKQASAEVKRLEDEKRAVEWKFQEVVNQLIAAKKDRTKAGSVSGWKVDFMSLDRQQKNLRERLREATGEFTRIIDAQDFVDKEKSNLRVFKSCAVDEILEKAIAMQTKRTKKAHKSRRSPEENEALTNQLIQNKIMDEEQQSQQGSSSVVGIVGAMSRHDEGESEVDEVDEFDARLAAAARSILKSEDVSQLSASAPPVLSAPSPSRMASIESSRIHVHSEEEEDMSSIQVM